MPERVAQGRAHEDQAAGYLLDLGLTIVTRRFKARRGEIDIVALEGDQLVFVEVKSCLAPHYRPEDAMGDAKRRAMVRAGRDYLAYVEDPDRPVRFDLIAIDAGGLRHYRDIYGE